MDEQIEQTLIDLGTQHFYASVSLKEVGPILFFWVVSLTLSYLAVRNPSANSFFALSASLLLLWGGVWLDWRRGWPKVWHGPVCEVNVSGITFWPTKSHRQFLPWNDLETFGYDMSDNSILFHTKKPEIYNRRYLVVLQRPPYVSSGLKSPAGEYLTNVIGRYWDEEAKTARYP